MSELRTPDGGAAADAPTTDAPPATDTPASTPDAPITVDAGTAATVGYLEDLHPMFEAAGCATFACHGATQAGAGMIVYMPSARVAYDDVIDRPSVLGPGIVVVPGDPDASRMVEHAEVAHVEMGILTVAQAALVRRWVEEGAVYSRTGSTDRGEVAPPTPTTCDLGETRGWASLPSACLPRCTMATWDAIVACRDEADVAACQDAAIGADATPAVMPTGGTDTFDLDCDLCLQWQTRGCIEDACVHQLLAFDRCTLFRAGDPCSDESAALTACRSVHPEIVTCQRTRDPLCVGTP